MQGPAGVTGATGATGNCGPAGPEGPPGQAGIACAAAFLWPNCYRVKAGEALSWRCVSIAGDCIKCNPLDPSAIALAPGRVYHLSFSANISGVNMGGRPGYAGILTLGISTIDAGCRRDEFYYHLPCPMRAAGPVTASCSGIIISTCPFCEPVILQLTLFSPNEVLVEQSYLSLMQIC